MNNQREIYEALLAGETLGAKDFINTKVRLNEKGQLVDENSCLSEQLFAVPANWQIYKEPKWYENIPEGGVLCWCGTSKSLRLIESFVLRSSSPHSNAMPVFRTKDYDEGDWWLLCEPLTTKEINTFFGNAPEVTE